MPKFHTHTLSSCSLCIHAWWSIWLLLFGGIVNDLYFLISPDHVCASISQKASGHQVSSLHLEVRRMLIGSKRGILVSGHKLLLLFHCRDVWVFLHMFVEVWPNEGTSKSRIGYCIKQRRHCASLQMILYQLTSTIQKALWPFLDATGVFFLWDVLIIALLMIKVEMPSLTDTSYEMLYFSRVFGVLTGYVGRPFCSQ